MQIFSGVQRDIIDKKTLTRFFLALFILIYPSLETVYPLLPPLLGFVYLQWRNAVRKKDYTLAALWMLYALIFESVWGLPLYGIWSVMIAMFVVFDAKITKTFHIDLLVKILSVVLFDLLYFAFLSGYGSLMNEKYIDPGAILLYYFAADILGVILF